MLWTMGWLFFKPGLGRRCIYTTDRAITTWVNSFHKYSSCRVWIYVSKKNYISSKNCCSTCVKSQHSMIMEKSLQHDTRDRSLPNTTLLAKHMFYFVLGISHMTFNTPIRAIVALPGGICRVKTTSVGLAVLCRSINCSDQASEKVSCARQKQIKNILQVISLSIKKNLMYALG